MICVSSCLSFSYKCDEPTREVLRVFFLRSFRDLLSTTLIRWHHRYQANQGTEAAVHGFASMIKPCFEQSVALERLLQLHKRRLGRTIAVGIHLPVPGRVELMDQTLDIT